MTTLIFGATGGVGSALARRLCEAGESLFLTGRDEEALSTLAEETGARSTTCDVLDTGEIEAAIEAANADGDLSGLVFAVGSIDLAPLRKTDRDSFHKVFDLNAASAAEALRLAEKPLKENRGAAVLFSTVAVQQGFMSHALISAAKGAVEGLTRAVAAEWAPKARINAIAPSVLDTGIAQKVLTNEKMREGLAQMHPIQRIGEADDAAAMAQFLLSRDSDWITGHVFPVDGGRKSVRTRG